MLAARLVDIGQFVLEQVPLPEAPGFGEARLRIQRVGLCGSDISAYYGRHPYIHCPIVLGHEFSGVVESVGPDVEGLPPGTRCTVVPHLICGECPACHAGQYNRCRKLRVLGAQADGAFCECLKVPAMMVIPVDDSVSFEEAALIEPGAVGYHAARQGNPRSDEIAIVFGAGPIGMFTAQAVKALGAGKVLLVDRDGDRLALAKSLGVEGTINVAAEALEAGIQRLAGDADQVDVFYDCVGFGGEVLNEIIRVARRGARVVVAGVLEATYKVPLLPDFVEHELTLIGSTMYIPEDFRETMRLMAEGHVRMDGMITHRAPLSRVKEIYRMIDARNERFFKIMLSVG